LTAALLEAGRTLLEAGRTLLEAGRTLLETGRALLEGALIDDVGRAWALLAAEITEDE